MYPSTGKKSLSFTLLDDIYSLIPFFYPGTSNKG